MIHNKQAWGGEIGHQRRVGLGGSGHKNRSSETRGIQTRHHRCRARTSNIADKPHRPTTANAAKPARWRKFASRRCWGNGIEVWGMWRGFLIMSKRTGDSYNENSY